MNVSGIEVTWHRGAIRSDWIKIRLEFDWIGIWYHFNLFSNWLRLDSNSIQFDSIQFAPPVTFFFFLLLLLLLLLVVVNLFHISNKYRTSMPLGEPPCHSLLLHNILISLIDIEGSSERME
jgi:hypothetical protein